MSELDVLNRAQRIPRMLCNGLDSIYCWPSGASWEIYPTAAGIECAFAHRPPGQPVSQNFRAVSNRRDDGLIFSMVRLPVNAKIFSLLWSNRWKTKSDQFKSLCRLLFHFRINFSISFRNYPMKLECGIWAFAEVHVRSTKFHSFIVSGLWTENARQTDTHRHMHMSRHDAAVIHSGDVHSHGA